MAFLCFFIKKWKFYDTHHELPLTYILNNPRRFKYTKTELRQIFQQFNEPYGYINGKASKVIEAEVLCSSWIIATKNKKKDAWVFKFWAYETSEKWIGIFCMDSFHRYQMRLYNPITLLGYFDGYRKTYTKDEKGVMQYLLDPDR